ncbi:MAG: endopeptidase La [Eubacterium sp.]|nr:endopeptidase La [Eubacterium sp.]
MEEEIYTTPVIPLRDIVVLPGMLVHLDINRDISKVALKYAMEGDGTVFITAQRDPSVETPTLSDLYEIGVIATIRQEVKLGDNIIRVMISTKTRAKLYSLTQSKPFLVGTSSVIPEDDGGLSEVEIKAMIRNLREIYEEYLEQNPRASRSAVDKIRETNNLSNLIDVISMQLSLPFSKRQNILETLNITERYNLLNGILTEEINIIRIKEEYRSKVQEEVSKNQKEYFLREQMRVIRSELGDEGDHDPTEKYEQALAELDCTDEIRENIKKEIDHLKHIPSSSSEHILAEDYIENLLSLPWNKACEENNDILHAEDILNEDHYGLEKVKERILEFLAVRVLNRSGDAPIVCLVGPPGTGKTSIAKSIARALEKPYVRISLGGVRDEAEIRGHRRTYVGALPGRLIDALKKAKVRNPLILLDEIDKVGKDYRGDTSSALLEVLDPEQNRFFRDHYIDMPVDLSDVLFICTANSIDTIERPLLDRMEVIRIAGYTTNEKFHIGKDYLVKKQLEKNGLKKKQLAISDSALKSMITGYTKEAGVRELERMIGKVCRGSARKILESQSDRIVDEKIDDGKADNTGRKNSKNTTKPREELKLPIRVSARNLSDFLGKRKYHDNPANKRDDVGIVRGLAWTEVGGDTLEIEVNTMPGEGALKLTGQLGDVMKESAEISLSLVRSLLPENEEFFKTHDFHLHVPEGAVPKDGPSAGVTMTTALYSAVTGKSVRAKTAMTGEVTLRGRVLPIGGLKEKLLAARLAGIDQVMVPDENRPDVEELEEEITEGIDIRYISKVDQILKEVLS